jgi:hypothetical protein
MFTMLESCASRSFGTAALVNCQTPVRFTFSTAFHSSSGISQKGRMVRVEKIAALLTTPDTPPKATTVSATTRLQSALLETSQ